MTDDAPMETATDKPRPWFGFFLRPGFLLAVAPFLILAIAALTYRSTRFAGIPPIDEIVDRETEHRIGIKPEDNAFTYYERACSQLPATLDDDAIADAHKALIAGGNWSDVTPAARRALASCEQILDEWKRGTECERGVRVQAVKADWYAPIDSQKYSTITCLAIMMSARYLNEKQADKSWLWQHALFRFTRHLGNPGMSADRFCGASFHARNSKSMVLWAKHELVTASLLKTAAKELSGIYQTTVINHISLKYDYLATSRILSQPSTLEDTYVFEEAVPDEMKSVSGIYLFLNAEPQLAELLLRHVFANGLSQCDRPRQDRVMAVTRYPLFVPSGSETPPLINPNTLDEALTRSKTGRFVGSQASSQSQNDGPRTGSADRSGTVPDSGTLPKKT